MTLLCKAPESERESCELLSLSLVVETAQELTPHSPTSHFARQHSWTLCDGAEPYKIARKYLRSLDALSLETAAPQQWSIGSLPY